MAKPGADEASAKRKKAEEEAEESESSSDDEAGPQPAAPGQLGEDSDTDGEAGPPAPTPVKQKKKRKLAHEKVCMLPCMYVCSAFVLGVETERGCAAPLRCLWCWASYEHLRERTLDRCCVRARCLSETMAFYDMGLWPHLLP